MQIPTLRRHRRSVLCVAVFGLSVAAYAALSVFVFHQPFHVGARRLRFFDLRVFRAAAGAVLQGRPLYDAEVYRGQLLHFTYPPFAALMLAPTQLWGLAVDGVVSIGVNLVLLLGLLRCTPTLWRTGTARSAAFGGGRLSWRTVALIGAVVLWCEPVTVTLGYGQVDLVIALLVTWDLGRPRGSSWRGAGVGLAAALKLTPLIFIPYLLLTGQRRSAVTATLMFLASVAVSFAVLPGASARYWGGLFLDASRTGDLADASNQAVVGAVTRLAHSPQPGTWALVGVVAAALLGLTVAVRAGRRGEHAVGFAVCAITSLLVSPVSWTHHWVLAIPAVAALVVWAFERRAWTVLASAAALSVAAFTYLPEAMMGFSGDLRLSAVGQVLADPYVILGLGVVLCVGVAGERRGSGGSLPVLGVRGRSAGPLSVEPVPSPALAMTQRQ